MALYDFAEMAKEQDRIQDRQRLTRNHEVNKEVRRVEIVEIKKRQRRYTQEAKKAKSKYAFKRNIPLQPAVPVVQYHNPPEIAASYTVIPTVVAHPTATLVGGQGGMGSGQPFDIMPRNITVLPGLAAVGAILILVGTEVIVSIAVQSAGSLVDSLLYSIGGGPRARNAKVRFHTGKGFGRGQYLRIRSPGANNPPPGGAIPNEQNTDPSEDSNSKWYNPWDWSF